eukprot:m.96977 g.96977  ORF g.96977 m.96977 type:complete len:51 (-) comp13089_c0_seq1:24-176(-)
MKRVSLLYRSGGLVSLEGDVSRMARSASLVLPLLAVVCQVGAKSVVVAFA